MNDVLVVKRNGVDKQELDLLKIKRAVNKAFSAVGLKTTRDILDKVVDIVKGKILLHTSKEESINVELIQDFVETVLMELGFIEVAKEYIIYRQKRKDIRKCRLKPDSDAISNYIHPSKYAKFLPEKRRRETFEETVKRTEEMHIRKFPFLKSDINKAFDMVRDKKLLPSMRSLQFAGKAIERDNARMFNCAFMHVDKLRSFSDTMYLLLCGCGVGYSVQYEHIEKLPSLKYIDKRNVRHLSIPDTIEGWANAVLFLLKSYTQGYYAEFNYSRIRPEGSPLVTSGGKAPGHLSLKGSLERMREILDQAQGRQLRPIECYDIMCHIADAVLSGGIRRSATICLFSLEDSEMVVAKTGKWWEKYPWRANSNNSVVLVRNEVKKKQFKRIFKSIKEFGEPGFLFVNDLDYGANPCVEIGLNPKLELTEELIEKIEKDKGDKYKLPKLKVGDVHTGVSFCNLVEINAAKFQTEKDFYEATKAAALIGTLQAAYTDLPYLGWTTEAIVEREALLGVSMTGMLDTPDISLNEEYQKNAAEIACQENQRVAKLIGVEPAARVTTVKPAGTTSLIFGCVGSGIHAHHSTRYIRRVTANELENVFQFFKDKNEHMCIKKPNGDWVVEFPIESKPGAILQDDLTALEFLNIVKQTQQNWIKYGTQKPESSPELTHNVSNTVVVGEDEWNEVAEFVWSNKEFFSGISFLPKTGDKDYAFSPREAIKTEADEDRWNQLLKYYTPVDYTEMVEEDDVTDLKGELACYAGSCEI